MGRGGGPAGRSLLARHGPAPGHRHRLLGDPATVILDAPPNGLDPEGIGWVRSLWGDLAADGRTVFVSSHLLNELALTAQHLIVIGRGRLLELTAQQASLEDAFMTVTREVVEFRAPTTIGADQ
jgi:ABC-2 type transport system ATP-binding protein